MRFVSLAAVAALLSATVLPALAQDVSAVTQASQKFAAALSGADAATASSMFTDDATVLPPGRDEVSGKPQVQMFLNTMTRSVQDLRWTSETIKPLGDMGARETGFFSFKTKGRNGQTPQDVKGKYLIVWEKAAGNWKIAADMWNRSGGQEGQAGKKGKGMNGGQGGQGGPATTE